MFAWCACLVRPVSWASKPQLSIPMFYSQEECCVFLFLSGPLPGFGLPTFRARVSWALVAMVGTEGDGCSTNDDSTAAAVLPAVALAVVLMVATH